VRLRSTEYAQKRSTAQAQGNEARASLRLAEDDLVRALRLFESGAITQAELDVKRARSDSASAQLAAALARLDEAQLAVSDTQLKAPLDGAVLTRQVEVGSLVAAGQPVFTLVDTRTLKAVFGAPQALVEKLRVGSPLSVMATVNSGSAGQPISYDARVSRIAPAADGNGRVFSVEAELPNKRGELHAGAVVSVRVPDVHEEQLSSTPQSGRARVSRCQRTLSSWRWRTSWA
jgi:multidrug efflux system membrane fusion protein